MFAAKQNNRGYAWKISRYISSMQRNLFPGFKEELGLTTDKDMKVITYRLAIGQDILRMNERILD